MNHGYCKNCWWFKDNICYYQSSHIGTDHFEPHYVQETSYCPDYCKRKFESIKLDDWIKEQENK